MAAARKEIKELEDAELAPPDLKARLTAIVDRLETVVDTELVPADGPQTEVVDGLGTSDATEPGEVGQRPVAVEVEGGSAS